MKEAEEEEETGEEDEEKEVAALAAAEEDSRAGPLSYKKVSASRGHCNNTVQDGAGDTLNPQNREVQEGWRQ